MSSATTVQTAFIGLGNMGQHMAGHIAARAATLKYPPLLAYNRTQARAEQLKTTHPVNVATSLEQVAKSSDIIFSCLLNDAAVEETVQALKPHLKSGTILVESSTISPDVARKLASELRQVGVTYIASPVMGAPIKAAVGELILLIAGDLVAREKVLPLLIPVIGKSKIDLGEDVGEALSLKLCGNYFVTAVVEMVAEGMTLGEASGVGQNKVFDLLQAIFPKSAMVIYGGRMLNNTYRDQVAFSISTVMKDVNHIKKMAKDAGVDLPITESFVENAEKVWREQGDIDVSGIVGSKL